MLQDWINGGTYTQLRNKFNASYGQTQRAADNVSWMIESMAEIGKLPEVGLDEQAVLSLRLLSRRVKFGVPVNAVEIMEIAKSQFLTNKGIGRSIAMKLAQSGIASVDDLLEVRMNDLAKIAGSEKAQVIKEGVLSFVEEYDIRRHRLRHSARAEKIGGNVHAVEELYDLYDDAFNRPVCTLLKSIGLDAKEKDTGAQPGDPDILIQTELGNICLECKTTRREEGSISLRKAQEVFGKSKGYDPVAMVTVGKPRFSPVATEKLAGSITLITCAALAEMVLQVWEGRLGKEAVLSHLMSKRHIGVEDL
jgi:helicase